MIQNTRVLVIDDEEIVRDSIREILIPNKEDHSNLNDAAFDLFDEIVPTVESEPIKYRPEFTFEEANNGKAGLEKVRVACENEEPYAVIFLDMRMPDWDGLKTCEEIRQIDPKVQIFFITAYSDRSIDEISIRAGYDIGYLSKPFVQEEIIQIATKGVHDWQRLTSLEQLLEIIGRLGVGNDKLKTLLINIFHQVSDYIGTDYAILGRLNDDNIFEEIAKIGVGIDRMQIKKLLEKISQIDPNQQNKIDTIDGILVCRMEQYYIFTVPFKRDFLNQEKMYLIHLFIENAIRAIKNAELSEELVQREKLSAIGQAITMVMHDIKNPIGAVQSIVELLKDEPEDVENVLELATMIQESTEYAMDIITDVRDYINNANLIRTEINLSSYLKGILEEVNQNNKEKKVELRLETPSELIGRVDSKKMKRVVVNLVNNAIEAMESHEVTDPVVWIKGRQEVGLIELQIKDNGPGIPEEIQSKIFDPFVTSGKVNGTGLGLAIVKQIIQAHHGKIEIESDDTGATFHISLPQ